MRCNTRGDAVIEPSCAHLALCLASFGEFDSIHKQARVRMPVTEILLAPVTPIRVVNRNVVTAVNALHVAGHISSPRGRGLNACSFTPTAYAIRTAGMSARTGYSISFPVLDEVIDRRWPEQQEQEEGSPVSPKPLLVVLHGIGRLQRRDAILAIRIEFKAAFKMF